MLAPPIIKRKICINSNQEELLTMPTTLSKGFIPEPWKDSCRMRSNSVYSGAAKLPSEPVRCYSRANLRNQRSSVGVSRNPSNRYSLSKVCRLATRAARFGPEADVAFQKVREKTQRTDVRIQKKNEGPLRVLEIPIGIVFDPHNPTS